MHFMQNELDIGEIKPPYASEKVQDAYKGDTEIVDLRVKTSFWNEETQAITRLNYDNQAESA